MVYSLHSFIHISDDCKIFFQLFLPSGNFWENFHCNRWLRNKLLYNKFRVILFMIHMYAYFVGFLINFFFFFEEIAYFGPKKYNENSFWNNFQWKFSKSLIWTLNLYIANINYMVLFFSFFFFFSQKLVENHLLRVEIAYEQMTNGKRWEFSSF